VKDAQWIAELLQHGLLRSSFIPSLWQRALRDVTRYRTSLSEERSRAINRLQKTLEDTNLKIASVVTDIMGASAQDMLHALLDGETDITVLAAQRYYSSVWAPCRIMGSLRGSVTEKVDPFPTSLSTVILPPYCLTIFATMYNPIPRPGIAL
jgi:hypothetical protein